ncbi:unnamed protein product [Mytilus coruscus]|uniref:Uncharacterized protein n=1 Tax=Mytilus coruscus TaxID=42192 RepID=A0A6J8EW14_MYTCO|nr:unnamed protein product [Mytilus coruscus]
MSSKVIVQHVEDAVNFTNTIYVIQSIRDVFLVKKFGHYSSKCFSKEAKDRQSKLVNVKSRKQKKRDTARMNSYIERKNIIRALPFSGMRNSAFVQYLYIANVLKTELNGVKLKLSEQKRKNSEQQKCIQDLKFQLNNIESDKSERDQFKQELENNCQQKEESASRIEIQEYVHQIQKMQDSVNEKDKTVKMVYTLHYLRSTEFTDEIQTLKKRKGRPMVQGQLNVTVGAKGECIDGHGCGEKEERTLVKSPPTEMPTASLPNAVQQESNADIRQRVVLKVYDTLFNSLKSKDDFPELMSYADKIISRIDEVSNKCIVISFRMETVEKLDAFWNLYHSGGLVSALARDILTPQRRQQMIKEAQSNNIELSDEDFQIQVYIKESDYIFVRDILTHKNEPLAPRNTMESVILHGTGGSFQTQHNKNIAMREYQRILSFRMVQMLEDSFVRDSIPEYLVQLAKLGAFEAVQLFYQSIIHKLETEFKRDLGNHNVCYLAYLLASVVNNECQFTDNGDNVELQVEEQDISFDQDDWKACLNYLMVISNRIRFNSTLVMTFLAVKHVSQIATESNRNAAWLNLSKKEMFPIIAGAHFDPVQIASLAENDCLTHSVVFEYMYYKLLLCDKIHHESVGNLDCLNFELEKESVYLLNRIMREGTKFKTLLYAPEKASRIQESDSEPSTYVLENTGGNVIKTFPTVNLHRPSSYIASMPIFWFNEKKIIAYRICLPEYTETTMSFILAIAQGINLHGSGEVKGEICIDPAEIERKSRARTKMSLTHENFRQVFVVSYRAVCRDVNGIPGSMPPKEDSEEKLSSKISEYSTNTSKSVGPLKMDFTSVPVREADIVSLQNAFINGLDVNELILSETGIDVLQAFNLCKALMSTNITQLILNDNKLFTKKIDHSKELGLRNLPSLEVLEMRNCELGDEGMVALKSDLAQLRNLRSIDVSKNDLTDIGLKTLCQSLLNNAGIRALRFHENNFGPNGGLILSMLVEGLHFLEIINVCYCGLGDDGTENLANALQSKQLRKINIRCNNVSQKGAIKFFRLIKDSSHLNHFEFGKNEVGIVHRQVGTGAVAVPVDESDEVSGVFVDVLKSCAKSIEYLGLWQCGIGNTSILDNPKVLSDFAELTEIILQANELQDKHATAIGQSMSSLPRLQSLMLRSNNIGPKGAVDIIDGIEKCPSLRTIILDRNKINDFDTLKKMVEVAAKSLPYLQKLDVSYNVEMLVTAREDVKYKMLLETARRCLHEAEVEEGEMQTRIEGTSLLTQEEPKRSKTTIIVI